MYPKYIKIVSKVEPTYAAITTDGEVTEIKTQSKEIEITSNGITNITPDSGFAYLDRVSVKTNVPTSGEGGGSASTMEYWDMRGLDADFSGHCDNLAYLMKVRSVDDVLIMPKGYQMAYNQLLAIAIDVEAVLFCAQGMSFNAIQFLHESGHTADQIAAIPRITEEEFYRMPNNIVLEDGASDNIKIVFEDLMSKISSYPSDEKFDSPLSSYGYDSISFGGNSFTRVGKYSLNVFGERDIIYLMMSEGDNPDDGWGLYRDNTVSPKEYGLNYPG